MVFLKSARWRRRRHSAAFSLMEVMMAAGILAIVLGSVFALNGNVVTNIRRGATASYASQLIQERLEQFRRASWTELTSNYPPPSDDPLDNGYDADPDETDGTVYVDDTGYYDSNGLWHDYATAFNYDLSDLDSMTPGLQDLLSVSTFSAAQLPNVVETVRVESYNPSTDAQDAYEPDNSTDGYHIISIAPKSVGGTPIVVTRQNGAVTYSSFNPLVVLSTTLRMSLTVAWTGSDNVTRTKEIVTLFTVEGDK